VITPKVTLVGVEAVELRLRSITPSLYRQLARTVEWLAIQMQVISKETYLNRPSPGPGGLHRVTGTLSRSIDYYVSQRPRSITATVGMLGASGTNIPYGRFWERGFSGVQHVNPFVRRQKSRDVSRKIRVVEHGWDLKRRRVSSGVAFVRGFDREVHQAPRPFLRPALEGMRPIIRQELVACMARALKKKGAPGGR
jgi:hypothetical protein